MYTSSKIITEPLLKALGVWQPGIVSADIHLRLDKPATISMVVYARINEDEGFQSIKETIKKSYSIVENKISDSD